MNRMLVVGMIVVIFLLIRLAIRMRQNSAFSSEVIAQLCQDSGVPNQPFDVLSAVLQVQAGTRPGISHHGQWWVAVGIEQIGDKSRTRLLTETTAADKDAVLAAVAELFEQIGGAAVAPPLLPAGQFIGSLSRAHPDILHARITGRMRPIGGWLVAVPPWLIDSG